MKEQLARAIAFAATKHTDQSRKDGSPYIYHPLKVAELLQAAGFGIQYQITGILHDTLEDTDASEEDIASFGSDVLDAVKLLTRTEDNEEKYVDAILTNHIATAVKSCDIICNMNDAPFSEDRKWSKKYIAKAKKYYYHKFSPAVDEAINHANHLLHEFRPQQKIMNYDVSKYKLFVDIEKERYEIAKERYVKQLWPDLNRTDIEYWYDEYAHTCFCFYTGNFKPVWLLAHDGWVNWDINPFQASEYGEELFPRTREEVKAFIQKKQNEGYFYDFVEIEKL